MKLSQKLSALILSESTVGALGTAIMVVLFFFAFLATATPPNTQTMRTESHEPQIIFVESGENVENSDLASLTR